MGRKFSLNPKSQTAPPPAEEFIKSANDIPGSNKTYPWEDPRVREDLIKMVSLRLSEPYILKLQYLSEKTRKSQQEIIREILQPYLDEEVKKY